jgi:hypothetical protein
MGLWRSSMLVAIAAAAALGCTSPESTRTHGGAGADVGNHPRGAVQIHAGAEMYAGTRTAGTGIGQRRFIGSAAEAEER